MSLRLHGAGTTINYSSVATTSRNVGICFLALPKHDINSQCARNAVSLYLHLPPLERHENA
jgi:hypothetical protein